MNTLLPPQGESPDRLPPNRFNAFEKALKRDNAPTPDFEKIEKELFTGIHNHREYEQPVNDVIAKSVQPSAMELHRIESRLEERIRQASLLQPWECYLKAEAQLPMGRWDAIEEKLFTRIERQHQAPVTMPAVLPSTFWLGLGLYLQRPAVRIAAALALAAGGLLAGFSAYQGGGANLETLVYQAQGASVEDLQSTIKQGRIALSGRSDIHSKDDGAMTFVNKRGFVEMRNGSRLQIEEASQKHVSYRVGFAGHGQGARGNVTFFVNKRKGNEKYQVTTPDYRIDVVGTFFRVHPDLSGHVSTSVLEGMVKVHSSDYGDFEVKAGQSLAYDPASARYRVLDGGSSIPREDIETLPSVDELDQYGVVTITSDIPGAEVRIDEHYKGSTPLVLLLPSGHHSVQLAKEGHPELDTMVNLEKSGTQRLSLVLPDAVPTLSEKATPQPKAIPLSKPSAKVPAKNTVVTPVVAKAAPTPVEQGEEAELLYRKADASQSKDWASAVVLYKRVLENPVAKPLRKEAAFFSIARLRAEHEREKTQAKEDFLRYLALYPDGAFSGESWLRLAELEVGRDHGKAIEYYLRSIDKLPRHPRLSEIQHRVGLLYMQEKKYDEAVAMFRQSLGNILYADESEKKKIYESLHRALVAKGDIQGAEVIRREYPLSKDSMGPR